MKNACVGLCEPGLCLRSLAAGGVSYANAASSYDSQLSLAGGSIEIFL